MTNTAQTEAELAERPPDPQPTDLGDRSSPVVEPGSLGEIAKIALKRGREAIVDWLTALMAVAAAVLLIRSKVNSVWLVLGGGGIGVAYRQLTDNATKAETTSIPTIS